MAGLDDAAMEEWPPQWRIAVEQYRRGEQVQVTRVGVVKSYYEAAKAENLARRRQSPAPTAIPGHAETAQPEQSWWRRRTHEDRHDSQDRQVRT